MVPGSKTSRAQAWREGWQPAAAGNKLRMHKQQVQLAGERCREPRQRLETTTAQREPGGAAQLRVGSPLQWLEVLTEFVRGGLSPGQSVMSKEHLEVRTAIKQRHFQEWRHSKEMMRCKKNKPSRSALLPSDMWQLPLQQSLSHAQCQTHTVPEYSAQGSSSLSGTHRLPVGNCFDSPVKAWTSQEQ